MGETQSPLGSNDSLGLASLKTDAVEWGNALNEAGWAALDALYVLKIDVPPILHNNIKAIVRAAIIRYIETHESGKA